MGDDLDNVLAGPCDDCGMPGHLMPDPYDQDVNNRITLVTLCPECAQAHADDI